MCVCLIDIYYICICLLTDAYGFCDFGAADDDGASLDDEDCEEEEEPFRGGGVITRWPSGRKVRAVCVSAREGEKSGMYKYMQEQVYVNMDSVMNHAEVVSMHISRFML